MGKHKQGISQESGFTLVETVMVLAIGALLVAAVFSVLGFVNQSNRDKQRHNSADIVQGNLQDWASNHYDHIPYPATGTSDADSDAFANQYLSGKVDPKTGQSYNGHVSWNTSLPGTLSDGTLYVVAPGKNKERNYQVCIKLESSDTYCTQPI